jgi:hypothetical protein
MADELIFNEPAPSPIYFGDPTDIGTVRNSDDTFSVNVHSGVTVLPDIDFTDSDGVTSLVPSVKDIVATPHHGADVENSDGSYTAHVNDAATLVVPDSVVSNSDDTYLVSVPATIAHEIPDITVTKYDGSTYTHPAGKDLIESTTKRISAQFPATYDDNLTLTADSFSVGTYSAADLTNVATVAYEKNGQAAALPVTLAANDTLKITITRTNAANPAAVLLR